MGDSSDLVVERSKVSIPNQTLVELALIRDNCAIHLLSSDVIREEQRKVKA